MKVEPFAGTRVDETQMRGMKGETRDANAVFRGLSIDPVAEHRMPEEGKVNAHLMSATGPELRFDQGGAAEALDRAEHREGRPSPASWSQCGQACAGPGATDSAAHLLLAGEITVNDCEIASLD